MLRRSVSFDIVWWLNGTLAVVLLIASGWTEEAPRHDHVINRRLWLDNWHRLQRLGMCGVPRPRVFYVEDHPEADVSVRYHPAATVLHRCDPSGGCCRDPRQRCRPLEASAVRMVFFVHSVVHPVDGQAAPVPSSRRFQSLEFVNHTQCVCAGINDVPRRR